MASALLFKNILGGLDMQSGLAASKAVFQEALSLDPDHPSFGSYVIRTTGLSSKLNCNLGDV